MRVKIRIGMIAAEQRIKMWISKSKLENGKTEEKTEKVKVLVIREDKLNKFESVTKE